MLHHMTDRMDYHMTQDGTCGATLTDHNSCDQCGCSGQPYCARCGEATGPTPIAETCRHLDCECHDA